MTDVFEHILVPYNGTTGSHKAFEKATILASIIQARLTILTCLERRPTFALFESKTKKDELEKERKVIEIQHSELKSLAKAKDIPCSTKIVSGDLASNEILLFARQNDVDLIIMCKTKLVSHYEKLHYHSTLENVFRNASCPLLILN